MLFRSKQEITEDNPLTSPVYKYGKYDGKKEGYAEASDEYEKKLLEQADEFLKQKKDYEKERDEYETLLDAYEQEIEKLENKVNRTQAENELLQQLLIRERGLMKLARGVIHGIIKKLHTANKEACKNAPMMFSPVGHQITVRT